MRQPADFLIRTIPLWGHVQANDNFDVSEWISFRQIITSVLILTCMALFLCIFRYIFIIYRRKIFRQIWGKIPPTPVTLSNLRPGAFQDFIYLECTAIKLGKDGKPYSSPRIFNKFVCWSLKESEIELAELLNPRKGYVKITLTNNDHPIPNSINLGLKSGECLVKVKAKSYKDPTNKQKEVEIGMTKDYFAQADNVLKTSSMTQTHFDICSMMKTLSHTFKEPLSDDEIKLIVLASVKEDSSRRDIGIQRCVDEWMSIRTYFNRETLSPPANYISDLEEAAASSDVQVQQSIYPNPARSWGKTLLMDTTVRLGQ
jgi:hypothetical protein